MLGAEQTGTIAGLHVGQHITPTERFPVERLAHITYTELKQGGYAHLDPEPDFCRWFAYGMQLAVMLRNVVPVVRN